MTETRSRPLTKIVVQLEPDAWHGYATETLWSEKIDEERYRLRSVPFYALGLSAEDVVTTRDEDDVRVVTGVSIHGGHSTYRIFLSAGVTPESREFQQQWAKLSSIGCTYERATERLFAVDIPQQADLDKAYKYLEEGEGNNVWHFEEGSVSPNARLKRQNR